MVDRRGVEVTFNWIFVIIAGSVLLLFFMYFAWKQIGLFNELGINEVVDGINNEIDAFSIGLSVNKIVELPKNIVFNFKCGEVLFKNTKKDTLHLIYAEGNFENKFNLWTTAWVFPFKIDNFYYASNIDRRFFVIGNENFFFNMPDKFQKFNSLENLRKNDILIDFTNSNLQTKFKENRVLVIDSKNNLITFYPENKKEEFYSDNMIYGAMFSNYEEYSCLKKKSLERLGIISDLYEKKADLLKVDSKCGFLYNELSKTLDLFKKNPLKYKNTLIDQNDNIKRGGCISVF